MPAIQPSQDPEPASMLLPPALTRVWWMPIAFIAAALVLLLLTPIVVNHRVATLRRDVVDVSDEARVQVNDLQAAFVARLYAHDAGGRRTDAMIDSAESVNAGKELRDAQSLDSLVRRLGPAPTARLATLMEQSDAWHALLASSPRGADATVRDTAFVRRGLNVLAAAEALDEDLLHISIGARDRVRYFAQMNLIATSALTPLALVALGFVVWMGAQTLRMAHEIERERSALQVETEARAALVRGVTHDVKNPLGAAIGYVALLQDGIAGTLPEEQMRILARVRRLIGTALTTIGELLDVARLDAQDAGERRPGWARVDLAALLAEMMDDYRAAALERGIRLTNESEPQGMLVLTDASHVRRIIANLLSNGIKYSGRGGRVAVSSRVESPLRTDAGGATAARRCVITVFDDGPGIAAGFRERLFTDFARADDAALAADGHGMGLAAARRLAVALGGDLRLTDSPLGGAGFVLELPM